LVTQTLPIDPKERRRQRDRERYAQMNSTKREELLKRHRESHKKQNPSTWNKENEVPAEDSEWLRRNDNYQRHSIHMLSEGKETSTTGTIVTHPYLR
jgi:hypothetical protein